MSKHPPTQKTAEQLKAQLTLCTGSPSFTTDSKIPPIDTVDDNTSTKRDTVSMNDITREEFNAKLETIEVKMDARVESVSSKIEAFMAVQAERDKRMESIVSQIATNNSDIKSGLGSMKTAMVLTAVSTVIAIVFGVASFNATLTSNMFSAFQAGKSESAAQVLPAEKPSRATPAQSAPPNRIPNESEN